MLKMEKFDSFMLRHHQIKSITKQMCIFIIFHEIYMEKESS